MQIADELKWRQILRKSPRAQQLEIERCRRDPWHWLTNWVWTIDQKETVKNPVKKFPDKAYLKCIAEIWIEKDRILIPKSRQMMLTWLTVALNLHLAQFSNGRYIFFQSKNQDDAEELVARALHIYTLQPAWMKQKFIATCAKLKFPTRRSVIHAIPQGANRIRMHTASSILIDEAAFQPEAEDAYTAAKPCIDGGGKICLVSSADEGFFWDMVEDHLEMVDSA